MTAELVGRPGERPNDVSGLADHFVRRFSREMGRMEPVLSPGAVLALNSHIFASTVRDVRGVIERTLMRCKEPVLQPADLWLEPASPALELVEASPAKKQEPTAWDLPIDLGELERLAIAEALRRVGGNRTHAARMLGISLRTLRNKLREWRQLGQPAAPSESELPACQEHDMGLAQSSQRKPEEQAA